jgi:hypothetical protein
MNFIGLLGFPDLPLSNTLTEGQWDKWETGKVREKFC